MNISSRKVFDDFTLGTAQLGLTYGIANKTGKPSTSTAHLIVQEALHQGVRTIDTAQAYGDAEARIGEAITPDFSGLPEIITKLNPLIKTFTSSDKNEIIELVRTSISNSCTFLKVKPLHCLLLHRWEHYHLYDGVIWETLLTLKQEGYIQKLGVSVYHPQEALSALEEPEIEHIQLPFNILDWRWKASGIEAALVKRPEVTVHARSSLLQGLLTGDEMLWRKVEPQQSLHWVQLLDKLVVQFSRLHKVDLCFAYVRAQPWIHSVVVGVETMEQLMDNLALFQRPHLSLDECHWIEENIGEVPENILNPARWSN